MLRCLLAALIPQRNIPARHGGSIHGKGTEGLQQRALGSTLQPNKWKITLLGAVAWPRGCSVQGPLGTCAPHACSVHVPTGCHGVSTSLLTWCVHLWSCVCAHHAVCLAAHVMHAHLCAHTPVQVHAHSVLAGLPASAGGHAHAQVRGRAPVHWHARFVALGSRCASHHSQSRHARAGFLPAFVFCTCQSQGRRWETACRICANNYPGGY